ncbi:MAG: hypothetical protein IJQ81_10975 [Oscillibacter sp.]|nr:hypothetical protein [Oscillibacter sp.]
MRVPLQVVIDAVESADNEWNQFLDIVTMEAVSVPESLFIDNFGGEYQKLSDMIEEEFNSRFFRLPSPYDIHEYSIMERFIWSLPEGTIQDRLENAIRGRGAFRRFKDSIYRLDMEQEWYDFRANAYREIAIEWCNDHGFQFLEP